MTTDTVEDTAFAMMSLFEGFDVAYGTYQANPGYQNVSRGKVEIKSTAKTVRGEVTTDLWSKPLEGVTPLGIIPICDNDMFLWGCIDVDS